MENYHCHPIGTDTDKRLKDSLLSILNLYKSDPNFSANQK